MKDKDIKLQVLQMLEEMMNKDLGSRVKPTVVEKETVVIAKPKNKEEMVENLRKMGEEDKDMGEYEQEEPVEEETCMVCDGEGCKECECDEENSMMGSLGDKLRAIVNKKMKD